MQAFDLDSSLVENYSSFSRSFSKVRAPDLKAALDGQVIAFHTDKTEAIAKGNSEKSSLVTTDFELGHFAARICGYERFALIDQNHDAASRVSLCAF